MSTIRQAFGVGSVLPPANVMIGGVELEIEDVLGTKNGIPDNWKLVPDGSLRNNGQEFVSPPLDVESLILGFKTIHTSVIHTKTKPQPFSERTSIHVHVNCLDLEVKQTKDLLLWYALFEPVFFAMVAPNRRNNIHCVPLDMTFLSSHYKKNMNTIIDKWSKYTAFNLLPLKTQGTIEFRHMEGHDDDIRFSEWLKTIENWWKWGQATPLTRKMLEQHTWMDGFDAIFKDARVHSLKGSVMGMLSDSLIDVKLAMV